MTTKKLARVGGLLYLAVAVMGGFAEYVRTSNTVSGDAAATASNVVAHMTLFRVGFAADLADLPMFLGVGIIMYVLFRPISSPIAISMLVLNAVSAPIQALNMLNQAGAMLLAADPNSSAQVLFLLDLHRVGYLIAQIFFGLYLLPLGYLVYRSHLMPKFLGWVLMAGSAGYLAGVAVGFAAPGFQSSQATPFGLVGGLAELIFLAWLLIRGVAAPRQGALGVAA
ncbi:MAG TPA: DUF4386 domain-containing protein [Candidatus Dormibacteraeota bacterium]|nr:DUF4386 domain-containing protein [Candidatus Dormibacteraeota bacterium]